MQSLDGEEEAAAQLFGERLMEKPETEVADPKRYAPCDGEIPFSGLPRGRFLGMKILDLNGKGSTVGDSYDQRVKELD